MAGPRVGVLALQGGYDPHLRALTRLGLKPRPVREPADLAAVSALVLPGGESTAIAKLLLIHQLWQPLQDRLAAGLPVLGTCAGLILLAREIEGSDQPRLGALAVRVRRNAYGRQVESFEARIDLPGLGHGGPLPAVFIRAPLIVDQGPQVETLATFEDRPVLVRQGRILAASFHPELTRDLRVHQALVDSLRSG